MLLEPRDSRLNGETGLLHYDGGGGFFPVLTKRSAERKRTIGIQSEIDSSYGIGKSSERALKGGTENRLDKIRPFLFLPSLSSHDGGISPENGNSPRTPFPDLNARGNEGSRVVCPEMGKDGLRTACSKVL